MASDLLKYLATSLVDEPDSVKVQVVEGEEVDTYELTVAQDDLGKVIGKGGRTARALRAVMRGATAKQGRRAHLEILE